MSRSPRSVSATIPCARYRYVVYSDGQEELYDHHNDPNEWNNRIDDPDYAEIAERLRNRLPRLEDQAEPVIDPDEEEDEEG